MHPISASILAAIIIGEPIGLDLVVGVVAVLAGIADRGARDDSLQVAAKPDMSHDTPRRADRDPVLDLGGMAGAITRFIVRHTIR